MNKYIKLILLVAILMVNVNTSIDVYAVEQNFFAQIQTENVFLFEDKGTKPLFEIPNTFYVNLLEDENEGYYKARYMNVVGYVRANEIQCVNEYPAVPYLDYVNFRILAEQSAELRSEPSRSKGLNSLITELPLYETNFVYYGKIEGDEVVPAKGTEWYYVSYTKNSVTQYGYVYSGLTDMFTNFTLNSISLYPIAKHNWQVVTDNNETIPSFEPPSTSELAIILAIIIPTILLLLIMLKTGGKKSKVLPQNSEIIKMQPPNTPTSIPRKKKRGKDYYEID